MTTPNARANHQPGQHGGQQGVLCQAHLPKEALEHRQNRRVVKGADGGGQGEDFPQHQQAHQEHQNVEHGHKGGQGHVEKVLRHQPQAGGAAGNQPAGQKEQRDPQGVQGVARQHHP